MLVEVGLWGKVLLCHAAQVLLLSLLVAAMQVTGLKASQPLVNTQQADGSWHEEPFTGTGFPKVGSSMRTRVVNAGCGFDNSLGRPEGTSRAQIPLPDLTPRPVK